MTGLEQYIAYLNNELAAQERHALEQKLVMSESARRDLQRARDFLAAGKQQVVVPPKTLINSVRAAFRRKLEQHKERVTKAADLEFDSWQGLATGVRATLTDQTGRLGERQMLYTSGTIDLDIQVALDKGVQTRSMQGQLLSTVDEAVSGIQLNLIRADGRQRRVLTDELGRFRFSHLDTGHYDLHVQLTDRDIRLDIEA